MKISQEENIIEKGQKLFMNTKTQGKKMIKVCFKAIEAYETLKPWSIFLILFFIGIYFTRSIRNNHIAVGIPFFISYRIYKVLSYYIFSSYYEFSYEENKLIIKKNNNTWRQILIKDLYKVQYHYHFTYQSSKIEIYTNEKKIILCMGKLTTSQKDAIKARRLITRRLNPFLLENSFHENIIEKGKKIVYEYENSKKNDKSPF